MNGLKAEQIRAMIAEGESINVDFKSAKDVDLRNLYGHDVVALVNEGEAILTNLETVEIANLANYIIDVNNLIEELSQVNAMMEESLSRYYEGIEADESSPDD